MKIIVGLGNPGVEYRWTRHNVGFRVVDRLAATKHIPFSSRRFTSLYGTGSIDSCRVVLAKPMTFMNRSGAAVSRIVQAFGAGLEDLIVVHDDLDLPLGKMRIKRRGGDGGHQGVRSIIESMNGSTFVRLKVGIGRPPEGTDPAEYVLEAFDKTEEPLVDGIISQAAESVVVMLLEGIEIAASRFQHRPKALLRESSH